MFNSSHICYSPDPTMFRLCSYAPPNPNSNTEHYHYRSHSLPFRLHLLGLHNAAVQIGFGIELEEMHRIMLNHLQHQVRRVFIKATHHLVNYKVWSLNSLQIRHDSELNVVSIEDYVEVCMV